MTSRASDVAVRGFCHRKLLGTILKSTGSCVRVRAEDGGRPAICHVQVIPVQCPWGSHRLCEGRKHAFHSLAEGPGQAFLRVSTGCESGAGRINARAPIAAAERNPQSRSGNDSSKRDSLAPARYIENVVPSQVQNSSVLGRHGLVSIRGSRRSPVPWRSAFACAGALLSHVYDDFKIYMCFMSDKLSCFVIGMD